MRTKTLRVTIEHLPTGLRYVQPVKGTDPTVALRPGHPQSCLLVGGFPTDYRIVSSR